MSLSGQSNADSKEEIKSEGDPDRCLLCVEEQSVKQENMSEHLVLEHNVSLFECSLCDANDAGEASKFISFAEICDHVEGTHNVTTRDMIHSMIKIPFVEMLREYTCMLCKKRFVALTEERLFRHHFKTAHRVNKVNSKLVQRRCRICSHATCKSETELIKHIGEEHPRESFYCDDDLENDDTEIATWIKDDAPVAPATAPAPEQDQKSELPVAKASPEKVEEKEPDVRAKRKAASTSDSSRSSSRSSSPEPVKSKNRKKKKSKKKKKKRKKNHDSDSEEDEDEELASDREQAPVIPKRERPFTSDSEEERLMPDFKVAKDVSDGEITDSPRNFSRVTTTRTVMLKPAEEKRPSAQKEASSGRSPGFAIKASGDGRSADGRRESPSSAPRSEHNYRRHSPSSSPVRKRRSPSPDNSSEDEFCEDCNVRLGSDPFEHFSSATHRKNTMYKVRCFLCSKYVKNPKVHLEENHSHEVFQCKLRNCTNPKFLELGKVINHIRDKHRNEVRQMRNDEILRRHMVSIPVRLTSYRCKLCNRPFVGQSEKAVLAHLRREEGVKRPTSDDILYFCRICGIRRSFGGESELLDHCKEHSSSRSRRSLSRDSQSPRRRTRSRSRSSRRSSRSRSRSRRSHSSRDSCRGRSRHRRSHRGPSSSRSSSRRGSRSRSDSRTRSRPAAPSNPAAGHQRRSNYLPCPFCFLVFETAEEVRDHAFKEHGKLLFRCGLYRKCGFRSITATDMFQHIIKEHEPEQKDSDFLLRSFTDVPEDKRRIYCVKCEQNGSKPRQWLCLSLSDAEYPMKSHMDKEHREAKAVSECYRYGCRICEESFELSSRCAAEWEDHSRNCHKTQRLPSLDERPTVECMYCFSNEEAIDQHIRQKHADQAFLCNICSADATDRHFTDQEQLEKHMTDVHSADSRFKSWKEFIEAPRDLRGIKCNFCISSFFGVSEDDVITKHFEKKHKQLSNSRGHLQFLCRICMSGEEFVSQEELHDHLRVEHGRQQ